MTGRDLLKQVARGAALLAVIPSLVSCAIKSRIMDPDRALEGSCQALAWIPGLVGQYMRGAFLSRVLAGCHPTAVIGYGTIFSRAGARIDQNVYVGPYCDLGLVHIERDAMLAAGVHVPSGRYTHGISGGDVPMRDQPGRPSPVRIGEGVWIGNNAVVMADVGANSIVGAGAVVTRPIPDCVVAAGVPARILRRRNA